jgi:hypothetical protein
MCYARFRKTLPVGAGTDSSLRATARLAVAAVVESWLRGAAAFFVVVARAAAGAPLTVRFAAGRPRAARTTVVLEDRLDEVVPLLVVRSCWRVVGRAGDRVAAAVAAAILVPARGAGFRVAVGLTLAEDCVVAVEEEKTGERFRRSDASVRSA